MTVIDSEQCTAEAVVATAQAILTYDVVAVICLLHDEGLLRDTVNTIRAMTNTTSRYTETRNGMQFLRGTIKIPVYIDGTGKLALVKGTNMVTSYEAPVGAREAPPAALRMRAADLGHRWFHCKELAKWVEVLDNDQAAAHAGHTVSLSSDLMHYLELHTPPSPSGTAGYGAVAAMMKEHDGCFNIITGVIDRTMPWVIDAQQSIIQALEAASTDVGEPCDCFYDDVTSTTDLTQQEKSEDQALLWVTSWCDRRYDGGRSFKINSGFVLDISLIAEECRLVPKGSRLKPFYLLHDLRTDIIFDHMMGRGIQLTRNIVGDSIEKIVENNSVLLDGTSGSDFTRGRGALLHMHHTLSALQDEPLLLFTTESPAKAHCTEPRLVPPHPPTGTAWVFLNVWSTRGHLWPTRQLVSVCLRHLTGAPSSFKNQTATSKVAKHFHQASDFTAVYASEIQRRRRVLNGTEPSTTEISSDSTTRLGTERPASQPSTGPQDLASAPRGDGKIKLTIPTGVYGAGTTTWRAPPEFGYKYVYRPAQRAWVQEGKNAATKLSTKTINLGKLKRLFAPLLVSPDITVPILGKDVGNQFKSKILAANQKIERVEDKDGSFATSLLEPVLIEAWKYVQDRLTTLEQDHSNRSNPARNDTALCNALRGTICKPLCVSASRAHRFIIMLMGDGSSRSGLWDSLLTAAGALPEPMELKYAKRLADSRYACQLYAAISFWGGEQWDTMATSYRGSLLPEPCLNELLVKEINSQTAPIHSTLPIGSLCESLHLVLDKPYAADTVALALRESLCLQSEHQAILEKDPDALEFCILLSERVAGKIVREARATKGAEGKYNLKKPGTLLSKGWAGRNGLIQECRETAGLLMSLACNKKHTQTYIARALKAALKMSRELAKKRRGSNRKPPSGASAGAVSPKQVHILQGKGPPKKSKRTILTVASDTAIKCKPNVRQCVSEDSAVTTLVIDVLDMTGCTAGAAKKDIPQYCKISQELIYLWMCELGFQMSDMPSVQPTPGERANGRRTMHVTIQCKDQDTFKTAAKRFPLEMTCPSSRVDAEFGDTLLSLVLRKDAEYGPNILRIKLLKTLDAGLLLKDSDGDDLFYSTVHQNAINSNALTDGGEYEDSNGKIYLTWQLHSFYEETSCIMKKDGTGSDIVGNGTWVMVIQMNTPYTPTETDCMQAEISNAKQHYVTYCTALGDDVKIRATMHLHPSRKGRNNSAKSTQTMIEAWDGSGKAMCALLEKKKPDHARRRSIRSINGLRRSLATLVLKMPVAAAPEMGVCDVAIDNARTSIKNILRTLGINADPPDAWALLDSRSVQEAHDQLVMVLKCAHEQTSWKAQLDRETVAAIEKANVVALAAEKAAPPAPSLVPPAPAKGGENPTGDSLVSLEEVVHESATVRLRELVSVANAKIGTLDDAEWATSHNETMHCAFELYKKRTGAQDISQARITKWVADLTDPQIIDHIKTAESSYLSYLCSDQLLDVYIKDARLKIAEQTASEYTSPGAVNSSAADIYNQTAKPGIEPEAESTHKQTLTTKSNVAKRQVALTKLAQGGVTPVGDKRKGRPGSTSMDKGGFATDDEDMPAVSEAHDELCFNQGPYTRKIFGAQHLRALDTVDSYDDCVLQTSNERQPLVWELTEGDEALSPTRRTALNLNGNMVAVHPMLAGKSAIFTAIARLIGTTHEGRQCQQLHQCISVQSDHANRGRTVKRGTVRATTSSGGGHDVLTTEKNMATRAKKTVVEVLKDMPASLKNFMAKSQVPTEHTETEWRSTLISALSGNANLEEPQLWVVLVTLSFLLKATLVVFVHDTYKDLVCLRAHQVVNPCCASTV